MGLASRAKDRRFAARQQPTKASSAVNLCAALSLDTESSTRTGSGRSTEEIPVLVVTRASAALEYKVPVVFAMAAPSHRT